ncbi:MAG: GntR family transcriptional regulator [Anaerolineaceae bacterium]|nr:GntR family transcriptional regulator [Anaerolineaceae bacterium]
MTNLPQFSNLPVPKYYQIYLALKAKVDDGTYAVHAAIPSERQLAEQFNVSRITVVKAIDLLVQEGLIERRQGSGNFVRRPGPALLEGVYNIAFVIPGSLEGYITTVLMGVIKEASQRTIQVQVMGPQVGKKRNLLVESIYRGEINGVIVFPAEEGWHDWVQELMDTQVPVVLIDRYYPEQPCDSVVFDDEEISYQLTRRLIEQGFERIAFISQVEVSLTSVINRLKGFQRALIEAGLPIDEDLMWLDVYRRLSGSGPITRDDMTWVLRDHIERSRPDAVFGVNHRVMEKFYYDLMLLHNHQLITRITQNKTALQDQDLFEIAQAGIVDHEVQFQNPVFQCAALQSGDKLGKEAFDLLLGRMNGTISSSAPIQIVVPMKMQGSFRGQADWSFSEQAMLGGTDEPQD